MNPRSTPDAIELELKFGVRDVGVSHVEAALPAALKPLHTRWLQNTYFDTVAGDLHRMGIAIRTRTVDSDHEMTVKIREPDEGGLSRRQEWNLPISQAALDVQQLQQLPLPQNVHALIQDQALQPVFINQFHRTDWQVCTASTELMLSLDLGFVMADEVRSPVSELELELVQGSVDALVQFGCELASHLPSYLAVISKAERGEWLLRGGSPLDDPDPKDRLSWLARLSRMLDPLAGPNPSEAVRALTACQDMAAIAQFSEPLAAGQVPLGLAPWMVEFSLQDPR